MIKLCGLWENTDKNGNIYFQGKLGHGAKVMIFKNTYATGEKSPGWILYIAEEKKKEGQDKPAWRRENHVAGSPKGMSGPSGEGEQADEERPDEPEGEDEDSVPF